MNELDIDMIRQSMKEFLERDDWEEIITESLEESVRISKELNEKIRVPPERLLKETTI